MAVLTPDAPVRLASPTPEELQPTWDGPPGDRLRGWVVTGVLAVLAAVTRLVNLGNPTDGGTPVFDEKHYVPQAFQVLTHGGLEDNPGYELVVHPPFGKQLLALGQAVFGYTGVGWRVVPALLGVVLVVLVVRIVRRMTRSTLVGAIAGVLLLADGVTFVQSRLGMLDIVLITLVVGALACLLADRDQVRARTARVLAEGRVAVSELGPRYGVRWWRFSAGLLLGLACATKWSGVFFVAAFGLLSVAFDLAARRRAGVRRPWVGTAVRDVGPALYALVLVPLGVYVASYWAWFASETGVDRWAVGQDVGTGGTWAFVPDAVRSLWFYSAHVLEFHSTLVTPETGQHPYESKPWTWPMGLRPMLYYYADGNEASGCGAAACVRAQMLIGTPAMWWLAFPVLGWALWRVASARDWRYAVVLVGYGAAWLPWFTNLDRQMYFFYATAMAPFLVMAIALVCGDVLGRVRDRPERRTLGLVLVCAYLGLVVANFVWLWPVLTGEPISEARWQAELWLPSWR